MDLTLKSKAMGRMLVMVALLAPLSGGFVLGQILPPKSATVEDFDVIGINCRTNNANEGSSKGCIGRQWGRLISEGLLRKVPNRADNNVVAVYTDYASDKDSDYTYVLGAKVNPGTPVPPGMVKTTVKAGRFAVFTSDTGPVQQVVVAAWKRIWNVPKSQLGGDRHYQSDFELYDERAANPANSQVDIFIRVH